ncbi:MAG: sulfotransferase family 2 domain-containing protein [Maritimibacter sp.]
MSQSFDSFVILGEMRTGSNFLESNINEFPGLTSYGEVFNPVFIGKPKREELLGVSLAQRNADPLKLIEAMRQNTEGLFGFRLFSGHDDRVFDHVLDDRRCAKIILSRNLVDAWVSHAIAKSTNQWALHNSKDAKKQRVQFDPEAFRTLFYTVKARQQEITRRLQTTGQAGFYINYDDLQDREIINGLARFLGVDHELSSLSSKFKKQNPESLADKVTNFATLEQTVNEIDRYDLDSLPNFEPVRTAVVPSYVTCEAVPLLYMPVQASADREVKAWMAAIDGIEAEALKSGMTQKDLRKWKRQHPAHRSFTVIRHPAERVHAAFCTHFLTNGPHTFHEIRQTISDQYDITFPGQLPEGESWDKPRHRDAFQKFLKFVEANIAGQGGIRVDASWATLGNVIAGFGQVLLPDHILREDDLEAGLARLAEEVGLDTVPAAPEPINDGPIALGDIYDDEIEDAIRRIYQRDFMLFGYRPWSKMK